MRVPRSVDTVALYVCGVLLAVAIWRIELMNDKIDEVRTDQPSGQIVTTGQVSTERFLGESLNEWARRHEEARERFREGR